ncbi:MAG: hypothetical protein CO064_02285 [Anaerolineae bacterium CG_4_9_14_0_8_um_filter_58_9]|nr:MAG: hypothetical protein CO064_02285 [Anaerolineae bacterium CG_4_9_14_0_8_um_filter_58_9]
MKKPLYTLILLALLMTACGMAAPAATPTPTELILPTATPPPLPQTQTPTLTPTATPSYPPEGYGPSNFPTDVDPLTGLKVTNPALLERRPLAIKVSNLPRYVRPQWGLSLADIVYEYYTEEGTTRFIALFYGQDAEMVGPIRSARFFDVNIIRGYKAAFAFGSAYVVEMNRLLNAEFANRLVLEGASSPLTRYDPNGTNDLVVNTADLSAFITQKGIENGRQNLDGMSFKLDPPAGGQAVSHIYARYSAAIYNRWDYDPTTGKYLRFSDTVDDVDNHNEQYAQLTDRLTNQPIAFDNVVVLFVTHEVYSTDSHGNKIYDILFSGLGTGFAFRDGQAYQVNWQRNDTDVVSLSNPDGTPFAFKPGATWFEVVGLNSTLSQGEQGWRFTHLMP